MFRMRTTAIAAAALIGAGVLAGCSSSSDSADTGTSEAGDGAQALPPVIITADQTSATCKVGNFLDVIIPEEQLAGTTIDSSDTALVEVTQAKQEGDALFNPGGKCLAAGEATLTLTGPDGATREIALTISE
jgi:hypothetical protein